MSVNAQVTSGNVWCVVTNRVPTLSDSNYPLTTYWTNTTTNSFYCLTNNTSGSATWLLMQNNALLAKAWVNFNAAATPTINASYNVSGVTRNSAGNYTITFTTPMNDANYTTQISSLNAGAGTSSAGSQIVTQTTTTVRIITSVLGAGIGGTVTPTDMGTTVVLVIGNLLFE